MQQNLLVLGAHGSFLVAGLHLVLCAWLVLRRSQARQVMRFFGGPDLQTWGLAAVVAATLAIMVVFLVFAFYGLAAAGHYRSLPHQRMVAMGIGTLYLLRGLVLVPDLARSLRKPGSVPAQQFVFSAVSLAIGLLHLLGLGSPS